MAYNSYNAPISYDEAGYNWDGNYVGGGKEAKPSRRVWLPDKKEHTKALKKPEDRMLLINIEGQEVILNLSGFESTDTNYLEVLGLLLAIDESQRMI